MLDLSWFELLSLVAFMPVTSRFKSIYDPDDQMKPADDDRPKASASQVRAQIDAQFAK